MACTMKGACKGLWSMDVDFLEMLVRITKLILCIARYELCCLPDFVYGYEKSTKILSMDPTASLALVS
ncbi:hypothetical protein GOP47_0000244 [Adiantum capillus-veneris]|uniref:Uncharacterized protein n=1 Tax=Adiantum capillus-veneris TaxID=13818 RepID=A0A9D4VCN8_ADICA|nr:hypothetical protein GOP47_0000244 [Adiantum capillus-veneris]